MRILMVIDANDGRGMFRHAYILAKELFKLGHHVTIAYVDLNDDILNDDGVKVYKFSGYVQNASFLYTMKNVRFHGSMPDGLAIKKLTKIIEVEKPDLIHAHGWVLYSVAALKKSLGIPIITTLHDCGYFCHIKTLFINNKNLCESECSLWNCFKCGSIYNGSLKSALTLYGVKKYFKLLYSNVDYYLAVSTYVRQRYIKAGFPGDRIQLIPNFYKMEEKEIGQPQISNLELPENFILFVGELSDKKGVDILLKAFNKINTRIKLVLIGLKHPNFTYNTGNNIIILENQPHNAVMEAWKRCRFGVVPSLCSDSCPTVALEAMACKKALVATNIGGLKDIIVHGETGYLYQPYDEQALINYIIELINNHAHAEDMGLKGYQRLCEYFSISKIITDVQNIYKKALNRG